MNFSEPSPRALRRRERRAAERLLDNSALRDELNDDQANELLEWGFDHIAAAVKHTARLADDDAVAAIEMTVTAVSRVMVAVNRMVAPSELAVEEGTLAHLVDNLTMIQPPPDDIYDQLALLVIQEDKETIFPTLMTILKASHQSEVATEPDTTKPSTVDEEIVTDADEF